VPLPDTEPDKTDAGFKRQKATTAYASRPREATVPRNLVASVAERLMEATASTVAPVSEEVLAQLVEHYNADASFLRHNDHGLRASVLVAERPPRRRSSPRPARSYPLYWC
jgi:hypothetical protein